VKITDLKPDTRNANKGNPRGLAQLEKSMRKFGFLEAGVLDKNNNIVGGNKRTDVAADIGLDDPIIIETDGTRPVYHKRTDIDLNTKQGREAAIALNRVAQVGIEFDPVVIEELLAEGVDLSGMWFENELAMLLGTLEMPDDPRELWSDMPDMGTEANAHRQLTLYFKTPEAVEAFSALLEQSIGDNTKSLWYPAKKE
jgi:hypothetical protein